MRKQWLRDDLSLLCKRCKILVKIVKRKKMKEIQKRLFDQIFQEIANVLMIQQNLIMLLCKLESEDIALYVMSSEAQAALEKIQTWVKRIVSSAHVVCKSFAILAHDVCITLNTSNQKIIIKRLLKNNAKCCMRCWLRIFCKLCLSEKLNNFININKAVTALYSHVELIHSWKVRQ